MPGRRVMPRKSGIQDVPEMYGMPGRHTMSGMPEC